MTDDINQELALDQKIAWYEKNKKKKFAASCKLEGIILPDDDETTSLDKVIEKYKKKTEDKHGNQ